jgi:hypothetical protein
MRTQLSQLRRHARTGDRTHAEEVKITVDADATIGGKDAFIRDRDATIGVVDASTGDRDVPIDGHVAIVGGRGRTPAIAALS